MDPRQIILDGPMRARQVLAVAICIMLNALDGFDVLSISFASPGIAKEWGIDRAALGIVLSMELIGMAVGSVIIGTIADRFGRRPTILGCLVAMAAGMFAAAFAHDVTTLSLSRLFTGLGIGGMLAATNAMTAEFSNARRRNLAVAIMAGGYPVGVVVGGSIASVLLAHYDWRAVFLFGGIATALFIPVVFALLPESIEYLVNKQPKGALGRVNAVLARLGHPTVERLPALPPAAASSSVAQLFSPSLARVTVLLTVGYFAHIMTFYFILKWIPKVVADMGFAPSLAGGVLVWASVGGALGAFTFSLLTQRIQLNGLLVASGVLSAVAVVLFGHAPADLKMLSALAAVGGFFTNAMVVGTYALMAQSFPAALRAGGTGFVIGVGRGGAALGPIVAGFLFAGGWGLPMVAAGMACGSLVAALAIVLLGRATARRTDPATA